MALCIMCTYMNVTCMLFYYIRFVKKIDKLIEEKPIEYLINYRGTSDETKYCR